MERSHLCTKTMQKRSGLRFTLQEDSRRVGPSWGGCGPRPRPGRAAPAYQAPCERGVDRGKDPDFDDQRLREVGRGRRRRPGNHQRDLWGAAVNIGEPDSRFHSRELQWPVSSENSHRRGSGRYLNSMADVINNLTLYDVLWKGKTESA